MTTQSAPGWMLYPVRSEQIKGAGSDDVDHAEWVIRADGPPPPRPVKVVPADELVEALSHVRKLGEDLIEVHEALAMALYHGENLRRYIDRVPVRDLAESEAGFQKAKRLSEIWHG